jgi:rhodanese-related sulfurtransferase
MEIVSPLPPRSSRVPNARLGLLMTGLIVAAFAFFGIRGIEWFLLKQSVRGSFPKVEWISTEQLAAWLADNQRPPPVLLDVRTEAEWNVSHLAGARRVDPAAPIEQVTAGLAKETPIVTYCAVGYRSGPLATRLREAGFTRVRSLEGSIFQWANEHRPLVSGDKPVATVHPYSSLWGRLLTDDVRAATFIFGGGFNFVNSPNVHFTLGQAPAVSKMVFRQLCVLNQPTQTVLAGPKGCSPQVGEPASVSLQVPEPVSVSMQVPEPASLSLVALGLCGALVARRRKDC